MSYILSFCLIFFSALLPTSPAIAAGATNIRQKILPYTLKMYGTVYADKLYIQSSEYKDENIILHVASNYHNSSFDIKNFDEHTTTKNRHNELSLNILQLHPASIQIDHCGNKSTIITACRTTASKSLVTPITITAIAL